MLIVVNLQGLHSRQEPQQIVASSREVAREVDLMPMVERLWPHQQAALEYH
jgi:hypothetical protein